MSNYVIVRDGELYHHGIKGQKWGIRRYENEDGTLTEAGKKRYSESDKYHTVDGNLSKKGLKEADRISKWQYSKKGQKAIEFGKKKGLDASEMYGMHKAYRATMVGTILGGPIGGVTAGLVSNHRYTKSGKTFAKEIIGFNTELDDHEIETDHRWT